MFISYCLTESGVVGFRKGTVEIHGDIKEVNV